ncbi:holin [Corynebacterium timonense]|uniref:Phage r1t holin n=1 Tax=Corynebacterium timonense TaxID=441500 RepID=A0A1H1LNF4_9CORY|nr:holin [Corynebacterium timonense]SDR76114.1 phage r1t holin [Corynebacterium timonense]
MFATTFWKGAAERAVKTFAQSLVAAIGVGTAVPVWELGWEEMLGIAATATVLSVLTSIASAGAAEPGTPSLVTTTEPRDTDALVAGAAAAELAGIPTANPHDPPLDDVAGGSHRLDHE